LFDYVKSSIEAFSQGVIAFTLEELDGVPKDVVSGYKKRPAESESQELYEITFKTPDIMPIVRSLQRNLNHEAIF
jgi:hypothetical protein